MDNIIESNSRGECSSTEEEVELLARIIDDERVARKEIPKILGKSYRQCFDDDDFNKVKKLWRVGIYSKVSAFILKKKTDEKQ